MEIKAGKYTIRSWQAGDETSLSEHFSNPEVLANLVARNRYPYTVEHAKAWIDLCAMEAEPVNFAIADRREVIGGIGLTLQRGTRRQSAEVGFWVGEPFWGRGVATTTLIAFCEFAFAEFDLIRLYANVFDGNAASVRVLEKAGFSYEGRLAKSVVKDDRVIDELVYALVRDREGMPTVP